MRQTLSRVTAFVSALSVKAKVAGCVAVVALVVASAFYFRGGSTSIELLPRGEGEELLSVNDANGSPHFALTSDFDPASNPDKKVPKNLQTDSDDILKVASSKMVEGSGPYSIVWNLEVGDETVECVNCAMLDARVKKIVKAVIDAGLIDGVSEIFGVDPARTIAGDYSGNGWQVEFVVGSSAKGQQAGEKIATWILQNSLEQRVFSVMWQNKIYTSGACEASLMDVAPVEMYPSSIPNNSSAQRDAAMDRVSVASPSYAPQFENREGAQFLSGWKATSC